MPERDYTNYWDDYWNDVPYNWDGTPQQPYAPPQTAPPAQAPTTTTETPPPPTTGGGDTPPTGTHNWDGRWDPQKPDDPGDGRVYIWMGDHWGLTEPTGSGLGPTGTGSTGGTGLKGFGSGPTYTAPGYLSAGEFDAGPAFSYKDFVAPDPNSLQNDPSFQWRFNQGLKALSAQKAGQGTFLSGATGKALQDYGQNAASQEYGNIWNRSMGEYNANRDNAFGSWAANYGQRKDAYGFKAQDTQNQNQFNLTNAQQDWNSAFSDWSKQGDWQSNWLTTLYNGGLG